MKNCILRASQQMQMILKPDNEKRTNIEAEDFFKSVSYWNDCNQIIKKNKGNALWASFVTQKAVHLGIQFQIQKFAPQYKFKIKWYGIYLRC